MTNPTPRKPSKITITTHEHGFDALVEIDEPNTIPDPELQAFVERRKRERREKREQAVREQGASSPPTDAPAA